MEISSFIQHKYKTLSNNGKGSLAKFTVVRPESRADIIQPKCKTESHVIHLEGLGWSQVIRMLKAPQVSPTQVMSDNHLT